MNLPRSRSRINRRFPLIQCVASRGPKKTITIIIIITITNTITIIVTLTLIATITNYYY